MRRQTLLAIALILFAGTTFPYPASAKNCKKGKPCGNTCIAWNKTCHVGSRSSVGSSGGSRSPMADPTVRSNQVGAHTKAPEERLGDYYVTASELYERTTPGHGPVVNKVYRGQKLTVYDIRDDWALVTEPGYQPRWVSFKYLSRTKPALPAAGPIPPELQDSRIVKDAIPKPGEDGHTQHDVDVLWKGAKWILNTGRCASIDYAAKSFNKPGTYFVTCGSRNEFFTEADLKK